MDREMTMKKDTILIVDDEPYNIDTIEQELEELGFTICTAENGKTALELVKETPPDVILLDIMMPIMDGFEVLRRLKADPDLEHIPVIVISAAADSHNTIRGIEMGAEDYLAKPFDPILLKARIHSCLERKHYRDLEKQYLEALRSEMQIARQIQQCFLPTNTPSIAGWQFGTWFRSAKEVAGDFYDLFPAADGGMICMVGDVCGKGIGAALFMTLFRSLLRVRCSEMDPDPKKLLLGAIEFTNQYISTVHEADNMFATVFLAHIPSSGDLLTYINGGNEAALVYDPVSGHISECKPTGPAVGIFPEAHFETHAIHITPACSIAIFTDGIPDALDQHGNPFGTDRIKKALCSIHTIDGKGMSRIMQEIDAFTFGAEAVDDITLLMIQKLDSE